MSEKQRILDMIEQGKISAAEGLELLNALETADEVVPSSESRKYKTLKILVNIEEDDVDVNVNIPLQLVRVLGTAAVNFSKYIPEDTQKQMSSHGVDMSAIDIEGILDAIENGTLDDPTIVDVNINDKESGKVLVKVYVD